jgi:hypothetical protein
MRRRTITLEATLRTIPDAVNVGRRTFVAIAPSDVDPIWDEMRVVPGGVVVSRAFDPGEDIVTGAPIAYVSKSGAIYVTKTGAHYRTKVLV